jgi:lysophospholipase L1-like esterase
MSVPLNKPIVVFFGDSRAADWPSPDLPQFTFINRGTGGQTSTEALLYFESAVEPLRPQMVVLQIGVNDLAMLSFSPEQQEQVIVACKNNIQQLVTRIVTLGAKAILTTIFPVGDVNMFFYSPTEIAEAIDEVNAFIHSLVAPEIIIFDAYTILASDDGIALGEYTQDLLHINASGYEALNRELTGVLAAAA